MEILGFLKEPFCVHLPYVRILTQYNAQRNKILKDIAKKCDDRSQHVFTSNDKDLIDVSTVVSSQGLYFNFFVY